MRRKTSSPIAQAFLERLELVDAISDNKLIERQQWKDKAESITAQMDGEQVKASGAKDKMASAVERCVDAEHEIDLAIMNLKAEKQKVIQTIEQLDSPTEYKLLHLRYVQYVPLNDIADLWGTDYTNITTAHGRALKNVQKILGGIHT